jgi:hypothetical protein
MSREQHRTVRPHQAAVILRSASVPSAMLSSDDATALKGIDHWSRELGLIPFHHTRRRLDRARVRLPRGALGSFVLIVVALSIGLPARWELLP